MGWRPAFPVYEQEGDQAPDAGICDDVFSLAFTSVLFMVFVFSALTPVSNFLGYGAHPEYIGMMAGIVAVDAFCCIPFAFLRYQGKAVRFAAIKLLNIFLNIVLVIFFLIACPWLYECAPRLIGWFYVPGYQVEYIFVSNVVTSVVTFCFWCRI